MRILIISPYVPWPLDSGGAAAQYSTLLCLAADHRFTLVCPVYHPAQAAAAAELARQLPQIKLRAVPCGANFACRSGLGPFRSLARRLYHRLRSTAPESTGAAQVAPYYPFYPLPAEFLRALQEEIERGIDLIQTEFSEMLPLGVWLPAFLPRVFVHHQIHSVYARRFLAMHPPNPHAEYLAAIMKTEETAFLRSYDAVIAFSEEDRSVLQQEHGIEGARTSPFPAPVDVGITQGAPGSFDGRFLFIGSEAHYPNQDALKWLLEDLWPRITEQLPSARLIVIGNWGPAWQSRGACGAVSFSGFVPDLAEVLKRGIMLVPVRIGSGIRTKILASLAQGTPVVTTSIGAEGLAVSDDREVLIRDDVVSLADAAVDLAKDPARWRRLSEAGPSLISRHYSAEEVRRRRNEIYAEVVARKRNAAAPSA